VTQSVALIGDRWDGLGLGSADLNYSFVHLTDKVPANTAESEIERALAEWSQYVMVSFAPSTDPVGDRTLAILFASEAHGDVIRSRPTCSRTRFTRFERILSRLPATCISTRI
jgi:hypothetical protein